MDYALAKELKEAGFPQDGIPQIAYGGSKEDGSYWEAACPTLSELIRACNEDEDSFFRLGLTTEGWRARDVRIEGEVVNGYPSPEEAVARLWLSLNKQP